MAGDVLLRKGHMERDCLSRASIVKGRIGNGIRQRIVAIEKKTVSEEKE